jgi:aminopeptidase
MTDPRLQKLASILVNYSTKVKPGDWVVIQSQFNAEPMIEAVLKEVLKAGGYPSVSVTSDILKEAQLKYASDEQIQWVSPLDDMVIRKADVYIYLEAVENTSGLGSIDPKKQQLRQVALTELNKIMFERSGNGDFRWVFAQYPCPAFAQAAKMSLREFEDFVYQATGADSEDAVAYWQKIHVNQQRMIDWLKGKKTVQIRGANADLSLSIEGRNFINSDGNQNMPSGEIYTSPIENSANGWVYFTFPAIYNGREVEGVRLEFKDGKVVNATAKKNEEFLHAMLDTDEGARYLGELGIGTNFGIDRFTGSILYDEKIGGTFHLAVGNGFLEAGGKNLSSIHWDLICDMREDGEILVDGEAFFKNGKFQV